MTQRRYDKLSSKQTIPANCDSCGQIFRICSSISTTFIVSSLRDFVTAIQLDYQYGVPNGTRTWRAVFGVGLSHGDNKLVENWYSAI